MSVDIETIIKIAGLLTALGTIIGLILKVHKFYLRQLEQDKSIAKLQKEQGKAVEKLQEEYKKDIKQMKEENALICYSISACLDGLQQLGANHTVPTAKEKLEDYLNKAAHDIND